MTEPELQTCHSGARGVSNCHPNVFRGYCCVEQMADCVEVTTS